MMSFLHTYKGVLYPVKISPMRSYPQIDCLVDMAATKLVHDATSTRRALDCIPKELYYNLMKAALRCSKDRSIEVLINNWPWNTLSIMQFAPCLFPRLESIYDKKYVVSEMKRGIKYTTCLAHTFVECLKRRAPTNLKCLDLTGFPSAEVIVNYVASHVLLVHNETRQREIISLYNDVTRGQPDDQRRDYSLAATIPDESYLIKMDAFVQTNDTYLELCRALKTSRMPNCKFKMAVNKLDISCLGVARIRVMLDQLDPQFLNGISIQYNALTNEGMNLLGPALADFQNITALDISCNSLNLNNSEVTYEALAKTLASLRNLSRLDLSSNRLRNRLRKVLSGLKTPLSYLRLSGCGLTPLDFIYLGHSHHVTRLREVDISENNLARSWESALPFLRAIAPVVAVLELVDTELQQFEIEDFLRHASDFKELQLVNLSALTDLNTRVLNDNIGQLAHFPALSVVCLSYPIEVYDPFALEQPDAERDMLIFRFRSQLALDGVCDSVHRGRVKLCFEGIPFHRT